MKLRHAVASTSIVAGLAAVAAPPASAGDYSVPYCRDGNGRPTALKDWVPDSNRLGIDPAWEDCATGGTSGGQIADWGAQSLQRPAGSRTGWSLRATAPLRIVGWYVNAALDAHQSSHTAIEYTGWPTCAWWIPGPGGCDNVRREGSVALDTDALSMYLTCVPAPGTSTCDGIASTRMYSTRVTYRDPSAPAIERVDGTPIRTTEPIGGVHDVQIQARDLGSGARYAELRVDGERHDASIDQCPPPYTSQQPCPPSLAGTLKLDTTRLADGLRQVQVIVYDASGGSTIAWAGGVLVRNGATVGPGSDPALRGAANGANAGDDAKVAVWWPATGRKPSKNKKIRKRCKRKSYARKHKVLCNGRDPRGVITGQWAKKARYTLAGRLTNTAGAPISGATLTVVRTTRRVGAPATTLGTVTTDATGRWNLPVRRAPGSANIEVTYRAFARDTAARAGRARVTIRGRSTITAPRTARRGKRIRLTGRLVGTSGQRRGVLIAVQVLHRGRWRTVGTPSASKTGRWTYRHKFSAPGTYRFRAVLRASATYPYAPGASGRRTVTVR